MEQLAPHIYRQAVPAPLANLGSTNAYLITSHDGNLLIDTGYFGKHSRQALLPMLQELGCTMQNTQLFVTHEHADHLGLAGEFQQLGMEILMQADTSGNLDLFSTYFAEDKQESLEILHHLGLSAKQIGKLTLPDVVRRKFAKFALVAPFDFTPLSAGEHLQVGEYKFVTVPLYGHKAGQLGLYEEKYGYLFCGDHLMNKGVPHISCYNSDYNPLAIYFHYLDEVQQYEVSQVFPGHLEVIEDLKKCCTRTHARYLEKLADTEKVLREAKVPLSIFDITGVLYSRTERDWRAMDIYKSIMLLGVTYSTLEYLYAAGAVQRDYNEGTVYFSK